MAEKAIIYYTDSALPDVLAERVRGVLAEAAGEIPIISVSQQPLAFGHNVCVGALGRSHLSLYKQIIAGLEATSADVVYLAEHDVLYHPDHFTFVPPDADTFWYNLSCWFANWKPDHKERGLYSRPWGIRHATSQLCSSRLLLLENLTERVQLIEDGWTIRRGIRGACEPGVAEQAAWVRQHDDGIPLPTAWIRKWKSGTHQTKGVNVDLRHGGNLTGWRRGHGSAWELPFWGRLDGVLCG